MRSWGCCWMEAQSEEPGCGTVLANAKAMQIANAARAAKESEMKTLQSLAWIAAIGLFLGAASVAQGQGGGMHGGGAMSGQSAATSAADQTTQPVVPPINSSGSSMDKLENTTGGANPHAEADLEKMRNAERQKKLMTDTERLLALANELKTDMDKTNKDTMSLDVIRKADEIEKLAHSVKEKMKGQ
jgi:hypothetical protein